MLREKIRWPFNNNKTKQKYLYNGEKLSNYNYKMFFCNYYFRSKLGVNARAAYLLKAADILVTNQLNF